MKRDDRVAFHTGHHGGPERNLIDDCVHCGFCLPACPTYVSWNEEMDSPRGRIHLMKGLVEGKYELTETVVAHFDRCLGCMGCVSACPSGVKYDVLIEATRAHIERDHRRPWFERMRRSMIFALFPYPKRLKLALGLLFAYSASGLRALVQASGLRRLLPRWLAELAALTPSVTWRQLTSTLPDRIASGPGSACVGLVAGCVQRVMFPEVNEATIRVLAAEACEVIVPRGQGCCGALSIHAGREAEARAFARALIERFESNIGLFDAILVNAAGCGSHLKDYGRLLAADSAFGVRAAAFAAKVRDVNEFLSSRAPVAKRHPVAVRVAYHDPCHLAHAQRLREEPRALLRSIPGLELVEIPEGDQCCGSAGIYNLLQPESARAIGERKADNVLATRAELLVSANPGCTLQIRKILRARGIDLPAAHPIEVLDASLAGRRVGVDAERIEHD